MYAVPISYPPMLVCTTYTISVGKVVVLVMVLVWVPQVILLVVFIMIELLVEK